MPWTAAAKQEFSEIYRAACTATDDAKLVQTKDRMLKILKDVSLSEEKYLKPKKVVPHIANRGGSKMQWQKVFAKTSKIVTVGVSKAACGSDRAVCFLLLESDRRSATAHVDLCKTSPHWAKYIDASIVDGASVGCGHWNQGLAAIEDEVMVPEEFRDKLCEAGKTHLDKDRLAKAQPVLGEILDTGLKWCCIRAEVAIEFPQVPNILQKALNVEHHIGEGRCKTHILHLPLLNSKFDTPKLRFNQQEIS